MLKRLEINLRSTPLSKKEIDDYKKKNSVRVYKIAICAITFFVFTLFLAFLDSTPADTKVLSKLVVLAFLIITIVLGLMAFSFAEHGSLLEPAVISEEKEKIIKLLLPNAVVKNYLQSVKDQERALTGLEVDALMSFFTKHYPEIQLEKIINDQNKND